MYIFLFILTFFLSTHAMDIPIIFMSNTSQQCTNLVRQLYNQRLFTGRGSCAKQCKVLSLGDDYDSSVIIELLCENIAQRLNTKVPVYSFGCGNHQLYNDEGYCLDHGITYYVYDNALFNNAHMTIQTALTSGTFKNTCDDVLSDLQNGWKKTTLAENPDIFDQQPESEWFLFVKTRKLIEEDRLMRFLLAKMHIKGTKEATCHCTWKKKERGYESRDILYLWIRKESFPIITEDLGLKIEL